MTVPAGFYDWARARGCSPFHPQDLWTPDDHAAYYEWKLTIFIYRMRLYKAFDQWPLMGTVSTLARIREWLDQLAAPAPSRPFLRCDCCQPRFRRGPYQPEPAHGLDYIRTFRRGA